MLKRCSIVKSDGSWKFWRTLRHKGTKRDGYGTISTRTRARCRLLARIRRRASDARPRHHLPAHRIRDGAVLPVAGSGRQGYGAGSPQRANRPAHRLVGAGKDWQSRHGGGDRPAACGPLRRRERTRPPQGDRRGCRCELDTRHDRRIEKPDRRAHQCPRLREKRQCAGARPGRSPQSTDRGAAPPVGGARAGPRRVGKARQGVPDPHRGPRPAAQYCARPAGAGIVALSLRLFWQAEGDSGDAARHQGRRRPLRVPVRAVFRLRLRGPQRRARSELEKLAVALLDLERQIPPEIAWVLRVDGHTDVRPIVTSQYPSNWALSAARAISVVQYLITKGVSPQRLVAAGFGEFQPLDPALTEDAFRRNRRLELKLTER